ncbi:MAG: hypothetical protein RBT41_08405 [Clostridia bacterium]|nr:hypothetical protein [Clostridia bacterium]
MRAIFKFSLIKYGEKKLWGRDKGKRIREQIMEYFNSSDFNPQNADILQIDFTAIDLVEVSFINELLVVLISRLTGEMKGRHLILSGVNPLIAENISVALEQAKQIALIIDQNNKWKLVGKSSEAIRQTFAKVVEQKSVDTPTLAELLQTNVHSVNNRLKILLSFGLVKRTEIIAPSGGIQYIYHSII